MAETGFPTGKMGTVIAGGIAALVLYEVIARGCNVTGIGLEGGISFACKDSQAGAPPYEAGKAAPVKDAALSEPRPAATHPPVVRPAPATEPTSFAGAWINVDAKTRGVTRLAIAGEAPSIHAWGACHPTDCDWGAVAATSFHRTVAGGEAAALQAVFKTSFDEVTMIVTPAGADRLGVEVLTHFTDRSGRADYSESYQFRRGE